MSASGALPSVAGLFEAEPFRMAFEGPSVSQTSIRHVAHLPFRPWLRDTGPSEAHCANGRIRIPPDLSGNQTKIDYSITS
jgi:hypothetical protein